LLPSGKLIEKPPTELTKYLCRLLIQDERITALQSTATKYTFITQGKNPKQKETEFWICVTTGRVFVLAATKVDNSIYQHHLEFQNDLTVQVESGKLSDTYILQGKKGEIRLESNLFRSSNLKNALKPYIKE
jgi:hypothetical protein